ncbi:MAG: Gfo/Idh/MocA family oxidoreductase [Myxococcaceae bacterium]|nr:Gfo/Idh/MocA family oxidoreductase [Myxococcaceae bacterium]
MSQRPLRVGVVGCGGIAQMMHLPHLHERPDLFTLVSVADVRQDAVDAVAAIYGAKHKTTNPLETIKHPEVEAVLLLASGSHEALAKAAYEHKKHLFVEKPFGYDVKETEGLLKAAKASGVKTLVGYHKRFDPAYLRAREAVRSLKDLRFVEVTVLHPDDGAYRVHHAVHPNPAAPYVMTPEAEDIKGTQQAVSPGGSAFHAMSEVVGGDAPLDHKVAAKILTESLIHDINVVRGVLGEPKKVVTAHTWHSGFAQNSLTDFGNGVHATLNWVLVPGLRNYEETVRFIAPMGRVTLTFPSPYLKNMPTPLRIERMDGGDHVVEQRTISYEEAFRGELHAFRTLVLDGGKAEVTLDDPMGDARWIQAIARAFRGAPQQVA